MAQLLSITPCLWFDHQAEEAARFYTSVFKDSKITQVTHYGKAGQETTKKKPGSVMTVEFELAGNRFTALNGGPQFKFSEAISLQVLCETQAEMDYFVDKLAVDKDAMVCGWLKDRYGLSWQVSPVAMKHMAADGGGEKFERVMAAMMKMKQLDVAALQRAYDGR